MFIRELEGCNCENRMPKHSPSSTARDTLVATYRSWKCRIVTGKTPRPCTQNHVFQNKLCLRHIHADFSVFKRETQFWGERFNQTSCMKDWEKVKRGTYISTYMLIQPTKPPDTQSFSQTRSSHLCTLTAAPPTSLLTRTNPHGTGPVAYFELKSGPTVINENWALISIDPYQNQEQKQNSTAVNCWHPLAPWPLGLSEIQGWKQRGLGRSFPNFKAWRKWQLSKSSLLHWSDLPAYMCCIRKSSPASSDAIISYM